MKPPEIAVCFTPRQARIILGEMQRIEEESEDATYRLLAAQLCNRLRKAMGITPRRHKTLRELDGKRR